MLLVPKHLAHTPTLDPEIRRAIADHFAKYGRDCEIEWIAPMQCFCAMVSLKQNDPLLALAQKGERVPTEDVFFHEPNPDAGKPIRDMNNNLLGRVPPYRALPLNQMSAETVKEFLEQRDTWSGRGEFSSLSEMVRKNAEKGAEGREKLRRQIKEEAVGQAVDKRRQVFKIPFLRVGIELKQPPTSAA